MYYFLNVPHTRIATAESDALRALSVRLQPWLSHLRQASVLSTVALAVRSHVDMAGDMQGWRAATAWEEDTKRGFARMHHTHSHVQAPTHICKHPHALHAHKAHIHARARTRMHTRARTFAHTHAFAGRSSSKASLRIGCQGKTGYPLSTPAYHILPSLYTLRHDQDDGYQQFRSRLHGTV